MNDEEEQQHDRLMAEARDYLEKIAERLWEKGRKAYSVVAFDKDAVQVCDFAQNKKFDLITMSTHGRAGLKRWALGSVADKVLQCSEVPVLLFRAS